MDAYTQMRPPAEATIRLKPREQPNARVQSPPNWSSLKQPRQRENPKQSILVVGFAKVSQETEGLDRAEAVKKASSIRPRPIIMTTAAMVFGVTPLLLATGPGAVNRYAIGLVIATGLTIGALISLYVAPVIYSYIAVDKRAQRTDGPRDNALAQRAASSQSPPTIPLTEQALPTIPFHPNSRACREDS